MRCVEVLLVLVSPFDEVEVVVAQRPQREDASRRERGHGLGTVVARLDQGVRLTAQHEQCRRRGGDHDHRRGQQPGVEPAAAAPRHVELGEGDHQHGRRRGRRHDPRRRWPRAVAVPIVELHGSVLVDDRRRRQDLLTHLVRSVAAGRRRRPRARAGCSCAPPRPGRCTPAAPRRESLRPCSLSRPRSPAAMAASRSPARRDRRRSAGAARAAPGRRAGRSSRRRRRRRRGRRRDPGRRAGAERRCRPRRRRRRGVRSRHESRRSRTGRSPQR